MKDIRRDDIEKAFERMLSRVGGGFKFTGWNKGNSKVSKRSDLSEGTDADASMALYGSDYRKRSHIVAYVGVIAIDGTLRIKAELVYFDDSDLEHLDLLSVGQGQILSSDSSSIIQIKSHQHIGVSDSLVMLYGLIERFNKNIAQF